MKIPSIGKTIFSIILTLCCFSGLAQIMPAPKTYVAYATSDSIKIDGIAAEPSWQKVPWTDEFVDIEGKKTPLYRTRTKMLWDDQYLYFYAELEEPQVWATLKQRDTVIFYNNDFEIFIDPDGDTHNYYEFEMNALNTVWDLFLVKPYREPAPVVDSWDIKGLKTAVNIQGTLNNPNDTDKGWSVEIAMPWEVLKEANNNQIPVNDFWRINFSRVNWEYELDDGHYSRKKDAQGNFLPEHNWVWSPQWVVNMHEPEKWGYVYFSSKPAGEKDDFSIPQDEKIRWFLYKLYRNQKQYFNKRQAWADDISQILKEPVLIDGKELKPELENHASGWDIKIRSPFSENTYIIREDGEFMKSKI